MTNHSPQYFVNKAFLKFVEEGLSEGLAEEEIAEKIFSGHPVDPKVGTLRQLRTIAKLEILQEETNMVRARLMLEMSISEIAKEVEIPESSVLAIVEEISKYSQE